MFSTKDHSCLNYTGRVVYNYYIPYVTTGGEVHRSWHHVKTSNKQINIKLGSKDNVFRVDNDSKLHGNAERSFSIRVQKISDMIIAKRWVDKSIIKEIELLGDTISSVTYSNSFSLGSLVTSNIETHYFSKGKCHIAYVASLQSYSCIDFTCFDSINNGSMQRILIGQDKNVDNVMSVQLSQIISIFFCETSRNPSAFLTVPMCLELADKIYSLRHDEQKTKDTLHEIHNVSSTYQKLLEEQQKPNISPQEKAKITKEISQFIDLTTDISTTPKSKVVKDVILSLFPLAMKNAVQASREISMHINAILQKKNVSNIDKLDHKYDTSIRGSLSDAKKFLKLENTLIQQYKKHVLADQDINYNTIVKDWFDIDINITTPTTCDVLITGLVDPQHPLADVI